MPDVEIDMHFEEAHKFIKDGIEKGEGVLVVCTAGISRSAAIVISYLIKEFKISYDEAFSRVKKSRVLIKPNDGFVKIL
jgi:protein-tyrosine phosphatase